jgi:hypothetical protein
MNMDRIASIHNSFMDARKFWMNGDTIHIQNQMLRMEIKRIWLI